MHVVNKKTFEKVNHQGRLTVLYHGRGRGLSELGNTQKEAARPKRNKNHTQSWTRDENLADLPTETRNWTGTGLERRVHIVGSERKRLIKTKDEIRASIHFTIWKEKA